MTILLEFWYVVACESEPDEETQEDTPHVQVWGPFDVETDARCFAIDVWHDNGWESVEAEFMTFAEAGERATTGAIVWPYKKLKEEQGVE